MIVCKVCLSSVACDCHRFPAPTNETAVFSTASKGKAGMSVPTVPGQKGARAGSRRAPSVSIGIVPEWLPMDSFPVSELSGPDAATVYAHLRGLAILSARKGRMLAGAVGRREERTADGVTCSEWSDPAPSLPGAHAIEDEESAHDAIATVWHRCASRGEATIPVALVRTVAKRMGTRRAQHRIRMRDGLTQVTDTRMPIEESDLTLAQLIAAVPASRRAAFEHALDARTAARQRGGHGLRTARRILRAAGLPIDAPV